MKKLLVKTGIVLAIGLVLLGVGAVFLLGPTSRKVIEKGTSYALGVETSLGKVDAGLGIDSSHLALIDLDFQNPEGFQGDPFLSVGELALDLRTLSVLSKTVKVPSILLDGLHLRLVQDGKRSNFREILAHVRSLGPAGGGAETKAAPSPKEESADAGPILMVDTIDLRGIQLTVDVAGIPGVEVHETFTASDLHLDVAGTVEKAGGMTVGHLTAYVVDELLAHGIEEAGGHVSPQVMQLLQSGLEGGLGGLKTQLEDQATEELDKLQQQAEDEVLEGKEEARAKLEGLIQEGDEAAKGKLKDILGGG